MAVLTDDKARENGTAGGNKNSARIIPSAVAVVELAGVEPASKQGTQKLSTRLAAV